MCTEFHQGENRDVTFGFSRWQVIGNLSEPVSVKWWSSLVGGQRENKNGGKSNLIITGNSL